MGREAMTAPTITKTERRQRERYIRGGQWDDAVLVFHDGTQVYAGRTVLYSPSDHAVRPRRSRAGDPMTDDQVEATLGRPMTAFEREILRRIRANLEGGRRAQA